MQCVLAVWDWAFGQGDVWIKLLVLKARLIPMNITPVILDDDKARNNFYLRCYVIYSSTHHLGDFYG